MNMKRIFSLLLSLVMVLSMAATVALANDTQEPEDIDIYEVISSGIATSTSYLQEELTALHEDGGVTYGFEWYIISLLRAGKNIEESILEEYYESVAETITTWTSETKPTDIGRTALALTIMDKDITNVSGVDLSALIYNNTKLADSSNELSFALLALDATDVLIPDTATWDRDKIITQLLEFQLTDGSFGLYNTETSDVDVTAICLQALAPYRDNETVAAATENAISFLKCAISDNYNYYDNSNTTAQVLLSLATLGIDVTNSYEEFGNTNCNIITALDTYRNPNGNGYIYGNNVNSMATVQIMQAYDAYRKANKENISYWDFASPGADYDDVSSDKESANDKEKAESAVIYVTIASEGTVAVSKDGGYMAQAPVTVTDRDENGTLSVDEALYAAHEIYFEGGAEAGYASYSSAYGLSLAALWGKGSIQTPTSAGYWLNNASCWSLADEVKEGDFLTAFNYYDTTYWSDAYSYLTPNSVSVNSGNSVTLELNYLSGYNENWAPVFSACSGANVVFLGSNNSIQKTLKTDSNGKVKISFSNSANSGDYYVMAYKEDGTIVPAVCKITVTSDSFTGTVGSISKNIIVYIKVTDPKGKTYLPKKSYFVEKGTTAYELLEKTGLEIDVTRSAYGIYVNSIEGLAEFDEGNESGWMFRVNGGFPGYSISSYTLSNGDYVELLYTRNLGKDIGDNSGRISSGGSAITSYTVKFETNGGNAISSQKISKNGYLSEPTIPQKEGFVFDGWYSDKKLETPYDFNAKVTKGFTLYAKWIEEEAKEKDKTYECIDSFDDTANYLINTIDNPTVGPVCGEWTIIGLARSGADVPNGYYDKYYSNVLNYVKSKDGVLHSRKYTEYSRVVLALTAIGKNPENVAGYNLVTPILDYDKTVSQGINGAIWAVIALDNTNYKTEEIINKYIAHILDREKESGGWSLSDSESSADADITAMALIALSNHRDRPNVNEAINRGITVLSEMQNKNGGYCAYNTEASESTAQVLTALSALGISYNDTRFVKNGNTLIDNILSYKLEDGSFLHTDGANLMATEQCYYALVAAKRLESNKSALFDMNDIEKSINNTIGLANKNPDINIPEINSSNKTFDDILGHKNQTAIERLAERGIISGMSENIFAPDNTMTRAEFATITVRALGLPPKNTSVFEDVNKESWYSQYVNTAYAYGIVNGVSETKFNPNGPITTEQACAIILRTAELCGMENNLDDISARNILAEFSDYMTVSDWAKSSVAFCFENNISDRSVIEIKPCTSVTRCQIADMLYNLLKGAMLI